jgi:hypothetical protein
VSSKVLRNTSKFLLAAVIAAIAVMVGSFGAYGDTSVPYTDSTAKGTITLCDYAGRPVTHGKVNDVPFVWAAVSSAAAETVFGGPGRTATLFAYQPRQGSPPQDWSGEQLTAGSTYADLAHPVAVANQDEGAALKSFMDAYPTQWDGLVQLRVFLGAKNQGIQNTTYPTADIQVKGDTWTLLRGGNVPCDVANASLRLNGVPSTLPSGGSAIGGGSATAAPGGSSGNHSGASQTVTGSGRSGDPSNGAGGGAGKANGVSAPRKTSSGGAGLGVGIAGVGILVVLGAAWLIVRSRRARAAGTTPS